MKLTTNHPQSSYGIPVLVDSTGIAYGPGDILPSGETAADYAARNFKGDVLERFLMPLGPLRGQGGPGRGQGAPKKPELLRKEVKGVRLPAWLWAWLDAQGPRLRGKLIEEALIAVHRLQPPP